jgi:hypothetical protein
MDPASIAAALIGASTGQLQTEFAAHKLKMNAEQGASIAQMLSAAAQNENQLASLGAGLGQNLDVRA